MESISKLRGKFTAK